MHRKLCAITGLRIRLAVVPSVIAVLAGPLTVPAFAQSTANGSAIAAQAGTAQQPSSGARLQQAPASVAQAADEVMDGISDLFTGIGDTLRASGLIAVRQTGSATSGSSGEMALMPPKSEDTPDAAQPVISGEGYSEHHPTIIELYTSQGCSACPPADALFSELAPRDDVIALALHVDYWDYIGWKDSFALPGFTRRQKAYARMAGERAIYTPQMIVEGSDAIVGVKPRRLADLIAQKAAQPSNIKLDLSRDGDLLHIHLDARPPLPAPVRIQLVRYAPDKTVTIEGGENAGQTIHYSNIVTDWQQIGDWSGDGPVDLQAVAPGPDPAVVIVQTAGQGPILAAERLR